MIFAIFQNKSDNLNISSLILSILSSSYLYHFTVVHIFCIIGTKPLYWQYRAFVLVVQRACTTAIPFPLPSCRTLFRSHSC